MKILLDTCVSPRTRDELAAAGHEVAWAGDWSADPGDEEILEAARPDSCIRSHWIKISASLPSPSGANMPVLSGSSTSPFGSRLSCAYRSSDITGMIS